MADEREHSGEEETEAASPEELEALAEEEEAPPLRHTTGGRREKPERDLPPDEETPATRRPWKPGLRDRAAAALLDAFFLAYAAAGTLLVYNYFGWKDFLRPVPLHGNHPWFLFAIFCLIAFLYFFISEAVFFTTVGKLFCRLSVQSATGLPPGIFATAFRNLFRFADILLFLPNLFLLEKTKRQQKLGDLLSGTVVIRHPPPPTPPLPVADKTASASLRALIGLLDLALLAAFLLSFALLLDPEKPFFSYLVFLTGPALYLFWYFLWEGIFHATPGQWVLGCRLAEEGGQPLRFSAVIVRACFRPFDVLAWPAIFLSERNQSLTDNASGTVVVHAPRSWWGILALILSGLMIAASWTVGSQNPRNFLKAPLRWENFYNPFLVARVGGTRTPLPGPISRPGEGIKMVRFRYLEEDRKTPRPAAEFKGGETVYFSFDVEEFTLRDRRAWVQEDLKILYPNAQMAYTKENMAELNRLLKNTDEPMEFLNTLPLPKNAQTGHYTLIITLHDRLANRHITEQRTFRVVE